jgi:hypothetical protein
VTKATVVVENVLATDYNRDIRRATCRITLRIDGADKMNFVAALSGQQGHKTISYSVQPDASGKLIASW